MREGIDFSSHFLAESTTKKYSDYAFYFVRFLLIYNLQTVWSEQVLLGSIICWYVTFLARSCSYRTIKGYISGLNIFLKIHELPPCQEAAGFNLQKLLQGIRRDKGDESSPKRPITPAMLIAFYDLLGIGEPDCSSENIALFTCMLVAFFGFFRKGNVTSASSSWENDTHAFSRDDIYIDWTEYVLWIRVKRTKTIQFGERILWVPISGIKGSKLDVIAVYSRMCTLVPAKPTDHAFCSPGGAPLCHTWFVKQVKSLVKQMGLDPNAVAGHSFRRGGAAFAHHCQVPDAFIKLQGDWRSNAYLAYIIIPIGDRVAVTRRMVAKIAGSDFGETIFGGARV